MPTSPGSDDRRLPSTVTRCLHAGERVLWEGGPDPHVVFARQDTFLIPFSLLWATFAAVWEESAVSARTAVGAVLGAPLVAFGVYIVAGRFLYKRRDRRQTRYAVTDRRALVVRRNGGHMREAPVTGPMTVLRSRDGGHGTVVWAVPGLPARRRVLTFRGGNATLLRGTGWPMPAGAVLGQVAFFDVDGFGDLLAVVRRAREAAGTTDPPRTLDASVQAARAQPYGSNLYRGQPLGGTPPLPPTGTVTLPRRPPVAPAGWYPDPDPASTGGQRWWDGVGWTLQVRPRHGGNDLAHGETCGTGPLRPH